MTHSTEPNDKPITPKPKIVQFHVFAIGEIMYDISLTSEGEKLIRRFCNGIWSEYENITGEIPE